MTDGHHKGMLDIGGAAPFTLNLRVRLWWVVTYRTFGFTPIVLRIWNCPASRTSLGFSEMRENGFPFREMIYDIYVLHPVQSELSRWTPACSLDVIYDKHHGVGSVSVNSRLFIWRW